MWVYQLWCLEAAAEDMRCSCRIQFCPLWFVHQLLKITIYREWVVCGGNRFFSAGVTKNNLIKGWRSAQTRSTYGVRVRKYPAAFRPRLRRPQTARTQEMEAGMSVYSHWISHNLWSVFRHYYMSEYGAKRSQKCMNDNKHRTNAKTFKVCGSTWAQWMFAIECTCEQFLYTNTTQKTYLNSCVIQLPSACWIGQLYRNSKSEICWCRGSYRDALVRYVRVGVFGA